MTRAGLATVAALVSGCDAVQPDRPASVEHDSAGVRIVENLARAWVDDEAWVLEPTPSLDIGALVGPPEYEFRQIHDATRFRSGTLALVEGAAREIRIYDEAGFHLETVTSAGERRFTLAPSVLAIEPDTLLVHDVATDSLYWMALDGEILWRRGLPELGGSVEVAADGTLLVIERRESPSGADPRVVERSATLSIRPPPWQDSLVLTETVLGRSSTVGGFTLEDPFGPAAVVAFQAGSATVAVSHPDRWEVRVYDPTGRVTRIVRAATPRTRVTPELVSFVRNRLVASTATPDEARTRLDAFDRLPRPDSTPSIAELHLDAGGSLWVGRWSEGRIPGFEVFDPAGRWLGIVLLPPDFGAVLEIGEDRLIALHVDQAGVPYLHVYNVRKGRADPAG